MESAALFIYHVLSCRTFWPLLKPVISTWHRVQNNRSLIQPSVNWGDLGRFDTSGGFDRKYVRSYQFRIARQVCVANFVLY